MGKHTNVSSVWKEKLKVRFCSPGNVYRVLKIEKGNGMSEYET